jgi:transcriptional regulator with XRE-family HTH domain
MQKRIELILEAENLTVSQFADKIGIQRSGMSHILAGRNKPSLDFVLKVLQHFPDLSTDWLLFGKGAMYDKNAEMPRTVNNGSDGTPSMDLFGNFADQPSEHRSQNEDISKTEPLKQQSERVERTVEPVAVSAVQSSERSSEQSSEQSVTPPATSMPVLPPLPLNSKMETDTVNKIIVFFENGRFKEFLPL